MTWEDLQPLHLENAMQMPDQFNPAKSAPSSVSNTPVKSSRLRPLDVPASSKGTVVPKNEDDNPKQVLWVVMRIKNAGFDCSNDHIKGQR
jgi:hypothetical protein